MGLFTANAGGVECHPSDLTNPDDPIDFLREGQARPMKLQHVHTKIHIKSIDLPLNVHQIMVRYELRTPKKERIMTQEEWEQKCER